MEIKPQRLESLSSKEKKELRTGVRKVDADPAAAFESQLENGEVSIRGTIQKTDTEHTNIFRVVVSGQKGKIEAVFKPCGDDHGLNCRCSRERAAYVYDKVLGFHNVPPTVVREVHDDNYGLDEIGSLQAYDYGEVADNAHLEDSDEGIIKLRIFDYLIWAYDRHDWNYLITAEGKITAIDNEDSFGTEDNNWARQEIMTDLENITDKKIPEDVIDIFEAYHNDPKIKLRLKRELSELIDKEKIDAAISRLDKLAPIILQEGKIPSEEKILRSLTYK